MNNYTSKTYYEKYKDTSINIYNKNGCDNTTIM